jgi:asparagine synthase (glutamine-hydrolysing)
MFALCADASGSVAPHELAAMAAMLKGGSEKPAIWRDNQGRTGFAAGTAGILPEDAFDRQPLISRELAFAARVRLDNRDQILGKLDVPAGEWPALADSEVLFLAYQRWKEECVQHLYGDYAFAAWHRDSGKVVAAVDHVGTARLYYSQVGGRLLVSTQLGALLAHPQVSRDLDLKALGLFVAPKIEEGSTPFKDVRTLTGGYLMIYREGTLSIRRWWQPDTAIRTRYRDPGDYVLAAQEVFGHAVRARLRTTGRVAVMMSGGLDSTLVAATAARQLRESGQCITACLSVPEPGLSCSVRDGWDADDSPYATAVAQMHDNLKLVKITPGGICTLDVASQLHAVSRTPVRNGANHIWYLRSCLEARATGARVMLLGGKGNATISWTGDGALHDLLSQMKWGQAIRHAAQYLETRGPAAVRALAGEIAGENARHLFRRLRGAPRRFSRPGEQLMTAEFRAAHMNSLETYAPAASNRPGQILFMTLPGTQWSADAMAQWGVEDRDPTGDRRLIELLLSFPLDAFSIAGWPRGLARAMGRGLIPDRVRFRRTRGAQVPELPAIISLHAARYRGVLEQAQSSGRLRSVLEMPRLHALLERVCNRTADLGEALTLDRAAEICLFAESEHS